MVYCNNTVVVLEPQGNKYWFLIEEVCKMNISVLFFTIKNL
jgi:hypothetical protein